VSEAEGVERRTGRSGPVRRRERPAKRAALTWWGTPRHPARRPGGILFPGRQTHTAHRQQSYHGFRSRFTRAATAAGFGDVTPHDLRATHATWVADSHGVMVAAHRLGHANASVTTRHYARAVDGRDAEGGQTPRRLGQAKDEANGHATGTQGPEEAFMIVDQGCDLVPPAGIEPATHGLGNRCSIP
jgi:hypothetical protein